jgi:hypothetical protein
MELHISSLTKYLTVFKYLTLPLYGGGHVHAHTHTHTCTHVHTHTRNPPPHDGYIKNLNTNWRLKLIEALFFQ